LAAAAVIWRPSMLAQPVNRALARATVRPDRRKVIVAVEPWSAGRSYRPEGQQVRR
jgi:hypothetical protein